MLLQMVDLRATINILSSAINVIQTSVQNIESDVNDLQLNVQNLEFDRRSDDVDLEQNAPNNAGNVNLSCIHAIV